MKKEDKNKIEALRVLIKVGLRAKRLAKVVEKLGGLEVLVLRQQKIDLKLYK